METPSWPRNSVSQSRTAERNTPAAWATQPDWPTRNWVMKPHRTICTVGQ